MFSILHISGEYPPYGSGGIGTHVRQLSLAQEGAGHRVFVFVFRPAADSLEERGNLTVRFFSVKDVPGLAVTSGLESIRQIAKACISDTESFFSRHGVRPDIIHAHDWQCFYAGHGVRELFGIPLVSTAHLLSEPMQRLLGVIPPQGAREVETRMCQESDVTITVSESVRQIILQKYGGAPARIRTVHNGIVGDEFAMGPAPERRRELADSSHEKKTILFAGRLDPQKGVLALLRSAMRVLQQRQDVMWLIAGEHSGSEYSNRLLAMVQGHPHLRNSVLFLGQRSRAQLLELYRKADISIVPSIYEPCAYTVLEAMAAGLPVIATDTGGIPELIEHGISGLLVPLTRTHAGGHDVDVGALAEAQLSLLKDAVYRRSLGDAAAARTRKEFSLSGMASKILDVYFSCTELHKLPLKTAVG